MRKGGSEGGMEGGRKGVREGGREGKMRQTVNVRKWRKGGKTHKAACSHGNTSTKHSNISVQPHFSQDVHARSQQ